MPPVGRALQPTPRRRTRAIALGVLVVLTVLGSVGLARPAAAADGMEVLCDRADYGCVEGTGYTGQSHWGANYGRRGHNCTSYVSYLLAKRGVAQPWFTMGNANQWDERGRGKVPVDDVPAIGAVAQWEGGTRLAPGPRGHVAHVEDVTDSYIELTDDSSSGGTRRFRIFRGSPYWPTAFLHIDDLVPPGSMADGAFDLAPVPSNRRSLKGGPSSVAFAFGGQGHHPVAGNWDGRRGASVGTFVDGTWRLANSNRATPASVLEVQFGTAGDLPVVGDWDGDGIDTVGVFRDGTWYLARSNGEKPSVYQEIHFGEPGDLPVAGDWDGDGIDTVGVYRNGLWMLSNGVRATPIPTMALRFGEPGDLPVVGNWDGKRGDTIGVFRNGAWRLLNVNAIDDDVEVIERRHGLQGDLPVVGAWNGKQTSVGVAR